MTNTLGAQDNITGLVSDLATTLRAAPELKTAPGLAVPVAQAGGDVAGNAQVVAHTVNTNNVQKGVENVAKQTQSPGLIGSALSWLGHAGGDVVSGIEKGTSVVGKELNKPLQFVQHEYRYLHDVEARHGLLAGLGETALVVGGAALAAIAAPETGGTSLALFAGVLGGEGTAAALGQVSHHDSWERTTNGATYVDPNTHQPVSIGRDFASLIGQKPGSGTYKFISGLTDGLSDLGLDPLAKAGEISGAVRAGRLLVQTPEDVVRAADNVPRVSRAFTDMSKMSAGDVVAKYPQFADLAPQIGRATTKDGVTQIFRNAMEINQLMKVSGNSLPALTLTSIPIKALRLQFADTKIARGQQLLPQWFNEKTLSVSNTEFDPMSNSASVGIYRFLRGSGQTENVARTVANNFLNSDDLQQRIEIFRNSVFSAVKGLAESKGLSHEEAVAMQDPEFQRRLAGEFQSITGGQYPGRESVYGFGPDGQPIPPSTTSEGNSIQTGIQLNQVGKLSFPTPSDMRSAAAMVAGSKNIYGKVDDWTYAKITRDIFKRYILLSGSFALHVSLSEVALNALKDGTVNLLKSRAAATIGKLGFKYGDDVEQVERASGESAIASHIGKVLPNAKIRVHDVEGASIEPKSQEPLHTLVNSLSGDPAHQIDVTHGGKTVGQIRWARGTGEVDGIAVAPGMERQGLASAMWDAARQAHAANPEKFAEPVHSASTTSEGSAWVRSIERRGPTPLVTRHGRDDALDEALASPERQRSLGAFLYHVLPGKLQDGPRAQLAMRQALLTDGDIVTHATSASHSIPGMDAAPPEEIMTQVARTGARRVRMRGTDDFTGWAPEQNYYGEQTRAWQQWLHTLAKDPPSAQAALVYKSWLEEHPGDIAGASKQGSEAATLWLQDHPEVHADHLAATLPTQGWDDIAPLDAWGKKIMLTVQGATTGVDGTIHSDLLDAIVKGHFKPRGGAPGLPNEITRDYLKAIDAKPAKTLGRMYMPDPTGTLERVANYGFDKVLSPIINFMSREPIYQETLFRMYQRQAKAIEDGRITEDEALINANIAASKQMLPFVHNIHEKTQLSETLHNFVPFWFAQQQAYKRVGRLLMKDPGAFRKYQLLVTQMHDIGSQQTSGNGTNYITFPGSGFMGSGVSGIFQKLGIPFIGSAPVAFAGSLSSLSFIMPGAEGVSGLRPEVGPLVAIPTKAIAMMFPEAQGPASALVGSSTMNSSLWDQIIPNAFVQHVLQGLGTSSRGFNSTVMATIQNLDYQQTVAMDKWEKDGSKGPAPAIVPSATAGPVAQQAFINKVRNQTRILYLIRAGLGMVTPISTQLTVNNFGFPTELQNDISKTGSVSSGVDAFLQKHPDATPYTVFQSTEPTGSQLPASQEAENWINANHALIKDFPYAAAWLMPQLADTKYSPAVYNEQLAQGVRVKRTPQEFLNALYIASGNYQYYNLDRPSYEKALASGNYSATALSSDFSAFTKTLGAQNPIWYDDFQSVDRQTRRVQTIDELGTMLNGKNPPTGGMATEVRGLVNDYNTYRNAITQKVGTTKELSTDFQAYLLGIIKQSPELAPVILSVFGPATSSAGASFSSAAAAAGETP